MNGNGGTKYDQCEQWLAVFVTAREALPLTVWVHCMRDRGREINTYNYSLIDTPVLKNEGSFQGKQERKNK